MRSNRILSPCVRNWPDHRRGFHASFALRSWQERVEPRTSVAPRRGNSYASTGPKAPRRKLSGAAYETRGPNKGNQTMSCDRNPWRHRELGIGVLFLVAAAPFPSFSEPLFP